LWSQFQRLGLGMYQHLISVSAIYVSLAGEGTLPSHLSPLNTFEHIGLDVMLLAFRPCASLTTNSGNATVRQFTTKIIFTIVIITVCSLTYRSHLEAYKHLGFVSKFKRVISSVEAIIWVSVLEGEVLSLVLVSSFMSHTAAKETAWWLALRSLLITGIKKEIKTIRE